MISEEKVLELIPQCESRAEILRKLGLCGGGCNYIAINKVIQKYSIDISHFTPNASKKICPRIKKICPVCGKEFGIVVHSTKPQQTVCSKGCANTYFKSGKNHPNYKNLEDRSSQSCVYREICFTFHKKKCILCGWDKIVDVHHIDGNNKNNNINNLIPLCPNHHRMAHSKKYKDAFKQLLINIGLKC